MIIITREQAKDLRNAFQCWQQDYDPVEDKEQHDMFGLGMVAMDALLASLEAEPVSVFKIDHESSLIKHVKRVVRETNAPPAQVLPDLKELEAILDWILMLPCPTPKATHFAKRLAVVIDTCRAAMLHGAEPVTKDYKLPFEQWLSQQTGTIDVECGCVMTEVFFHWLRVAYEAGNSPVIPDGWVMVPVEPTGEMLQSGISAHYERSKIQIHDRPAPGPMECAYVSMIAAAPQQEVK